MMDVGDVMAESAKILLELTKCVKDLEARLAALEERVKEGGL